MLRKRLFAGVAAVIMSATLLTGCVNEPDMIKQEEQIDISLSWWGNDDRNEYTIKAIEKFEELHPNINVVCSYSEWSGYQSRYNVQMISNTEADVMQINYSWLSQYSSDGNGYYNLYDLADVIDLTNFDEEELSYGVKNSCLNAIPIALNTETIYINKSIYDKYGLDIPVSYDDYFKAAQVMSKDDIYPLSANYKAAWFFIVAYAEQVADKQLMTIDGDLLFTADDIQIMLEFYKRLIDEKVIPQTEYYDRLNIGSAQYGGTIAWISDAENYCGSAIENGYEYVVGEYPSVTGEKCVYWYSKPATMYAVSKNTEHPKEAAMLLDFLLNSNEMAEFQGIEKGIPLSDNAQIYLEEHEMLGGIQFEAYCKMNENYAGINVISPYFENSELIEAFDDACNAVLYDKSTAEEKASELYETFQSILSEAKG